MNNKKEQKPIEKTLFKRPWFWVIFTIVVISITLIVFLFVNRQVDPKLDKNGDPVFVELTNEVYTNADDYLGYYINIKGKVFQVLGDNGSSKGVQVWLDPKTCNQNLWIYYSNDAEIKQDDYIVCSGYIKDITSYDNNYGAKVSAPLIVSSDIKKTDYIEVMSPSINYIDFSGLKATQHNYSISIDKVEFAEKETRVYFTADNKGKSKMYTGVGNSVILQNSKQYNVKENFDADYETIPFEIYSGVTSSGIVSFPNIEQDNFQLIVQIQSDNVNEKFTKMTFNINPANKNGTVESTEQKKSESKPTSTKSKSTYASIVGKYQGTEDNMGNVTATFHSNGTLNISTSSGNFTGTWTQTKGQAHFTLFDETDDEWTAQDVTVSSKGIDGLWGEFYQRVN